MSFSPDHPEYGRFSDVYVDESSQTKHRYLLIGALILPTSSVPVFNDQLERARRPELPDGEIAWTKVSRTKLPAYVRVVDTFFNNDMRFRHLDFHSLHIDTQLVNHRAFNAGSKEIGFNNVIHGTGMRGRFTIWARQLRQAR